jgi:hypothetical protein
METPAVINNAWAICDSFLAKTVQSASLSAAIPPQAIHVAFIRFFVSVIVI